MGFPAEGGINAQFFTAGVKLAKWGQSIGGERISFSTTCADCDATFGSSDYSVHLRRDGTWWVADTVDDRNQRRNNAAMFSNFDLAEKYL